MSKKFGTILAVLSAAVMAGTPVYAANLVLNGNFEEGIYNPTYPHYSSSDEFPISNWNLAGGSGLNDESGPFWDGVVNRPRGGLKLKRPAPVALFWMDPGDWAEKPDSRNELHRAGVLDELPTKTFVRRPDGQKPVRLTTI